MQSKLPLLSETAGVFLYDDGVRLPAFAWQAETVTAFSVFEGIA